jgi:hypothetical protein
VSCEPQGCKGRKGRGAKAEIDSCFMPDLGYSLLFVLFHIAGIINMCHFAQSLDKMGGGGLTNFFPGLA